ncbi:MAG: KpsF/GutQ family sugar-phosphate isomerase [Pseudomonadota bacterium]
MPHPTDAADLSVDVAAAAAETVKIEIAGLHMLADALSPSTPLAKTLEEAVRATRAAEGRMIVTGMGKSGHIGRKIAATLASTGQPAMFVHPGEASHGDLGMIEERDVILALSNSGETPELSDVLGYARRFGIPLMGMTSNPESTLAKASTIPLVLPKAPEACSETAAPTTSTTLMIALGDALAVALLRARGFTSADFKTYHPGGKLGAQLRRVSDLVPEGRIPPLVSEGDPVTEAVRVISDEGFGCVGVANAKGKLIGIITDGDLRRHIDDLTGAAVEDIMTRDPKTVAPDTVAGEALSYLSKTGITALFIVENDRPTSLLHVHDCLKQGVL